MTTTGPATPLQRLGELVALIEAVLFGLDAILHTGIELRMGSFTLSEPVILSAVLLESAVALGLLLAVILPGRGPLRAARVLAAQALAVASVLAVHVALAYDLVPRTRSNELLHAMLLALSFASMFLIAWPRTPVPADGSRRPAPGSGRNDAATHAAPPPRVT